MFSPGRGGKDREDQGNDHSRTRKSRPQSQYLRLQWVRDGRQLGAVRVWGDNGNAATGQGPGDEVPTAMQDGPRPRNEVKGPWETGTEEGRMGPAEVGKRRLRTTASRLRILQLMLVRPGPVLAGARPACRVHAELQALGVHVVRNRLDAGRKANRIRGDGAVGTAFHLPTVFSRQQQVR